MTSYFEEITRLRAMPLDQLSGQDRRLKLLVEHPETSPDDVGSLPYLIHPPSVMAPSSAFERFRDLTLGPMMRTQPNDPALPKFLRCVVEVLAWRATIAPGDRFWRD